MDISFPVSGVDRDVLGTLIEHAEANAERLTELAREVEGDDEAQKDYARRAEEAFTAATIGRVLLAAEPR